MSEKKLSFAGRGSCPLCPPPPPPPAMYGPALNSVAKRYNKLNGYLGVVPLFFPTGTGK